MRRFSNQIVTGALALALICLAIPANAQTDSCFSVESFVAASDVNGDGIPLTVADYVLLIRGIQGDTIIWGDTILDTGLVIELDGYSNSFYPEIPNIGEVVAYTRYFAFGLSSVPIINCPNLNEPSGSELEIVISAPFSLNGISSAQYNVRLKNTGDDTAYVWGLTVPFDLQLIGPDFLSFSNTFDSIYSESGWVGSSVALDSSYTLVSLYPNVGGAQAAIAIAPGEEKPLFDFTLDWIATSGIQVVPRLYTTSFNTTPYVILSKSPSGATATEILSMTLESCCGPVGDANNDGRISIADVTHTIGLIFGDGLLPECITGADINTDNKITIGDVTATIGHIFVEPLNLSCASCLYKPEVLYPFWDNGDVNLNGIDNEVADWVVMSHYLLNGFDAYNIDILGQLAQADLDKNCEANTVGDFVTQGRIITGEISPDVPNPPKHYLDTAVVQVADGIVSTDSEMRAVVFVFAGQASLELLASGMLFDTAYFDGYTHALVYSSLSAGLSALALGDILRSDRTLLRIEAADKFGALYEIDIQIISPAKPTTIVQ